MEERICIFGDSIVWGANDLEKQGWVNRLTIYCENNLSYDCFIYNLGIPSETTKDLLKRIKSESNSRNPSKIIIAIGINDTKVALDTSQTKIDKKTFIKNIKRLISITNNLSKVVVFIGLTKVFEANSNPTIWNKNEAYLNKIIEEYNEIIMNLCNKKKIKFIDVFQLLKPEDLSDDGVHPNNSGHNKIFEFLKDKIL